MKTDSINQTIQFDAEPKQIYDLIMDAKLHSAFTGSPVVMSDEIKGTFSVFDGYCTGYNIDLVDGEKIVQAWNFKEDGWPEDHYSICTFDLKKTTNGCILYFNQSDVPEHKIKALSDGWNEYYWEPIKNYLAIK